MSIQINIKFPPGQLDNLMREWVWRDLREAAWPGLPVVEYIRCTLYAAAGLPYRCDRDEDEPAAVTPVPPQPVEVPPAARARADVRVPRHSPERFIAFLGEDRDSRWPWNGSAA